CSSATRQLVSERSKGTGAWSRSSVAAPSWPSSGSRRHTKTMPCAPFARRSISARRCRRLAVSSNRGSASALGRSSSAARHPPRPPAASVSGAVISAAKRLEEAAAAGEILLGAATVRLARDAVKVSPLEQRPLGKEGLLDAWPLLELIEGAPAISRHFEAPLVG